MRNVTKKIRRFWRVARPLLSLTLSAGLIAFILSDVDWPALRASLQMMNAGPLAAAFLLMLTGDFFLSLKCFFLRPDLSFRRVYCMFLNMRFFSLMPGGSVAGEAARLVSLRDMTGMRAAAAIVIMDKQTHMIPAQAFCLIGLLLSTATLPRPLSLLTDLAMATPLLVPGALFLAPTRRFVLRQGHRLRRWQLGRVLEDQLARLCGFCEALARHPRQLGMHLLSGFLGEGCTIATLMLLSDNLGLPLPAHNWLWLNSVMLLAMAIPLSAMGMGVREGAMVLLRLFGIPQSQAMGLPLIISALTLIKGIVGGTVAALDRRARQQRALFD